MLNKCSLDFPCYNSFGTLNIFLSWELTLGNKFFALTLRVFFILLSTLALYFNVMFLSFLNSLVPIYNYSSLLKTRPCYIGIYIIKYYCLRLLKDFIIV